VKDADREMDEVVAAVRRKNMCAADRTNQTRYFVCGCGRSFRRQGDIRTSVTKIRQCRGPGCLQGPTITVFSTMGGFQGFQGFKVCVCVCGKCTELFILT